MKAATVVLTIVAIINHIDVMAERDFHRDADSLQGKPSGSLYSTIWETGLKERCILVGVAASYIFNSEEPYGGGANVCLLTSCKLSCFRIGIRDMTIMRLTGDKRASVNACLGSIIAPSVSPLLAFQVPITMNPESKRYLLLEMSSFFQFKFEKLYNSRCDKHEYSGMSIAPYCLVAYQGVDRWFFHELSIRLNYALNGLVLSGGDPLPEKAFWTEFVATIGIGRF